MDLVDLDRAAEDVKYAGAAKIEASLQPLLSHLSLTTDFLGGVRPVMLATCILSKKDTNFVRSTLEQLIAHKHNHVASGGRRPKAPRFVARIVDAYARRITEACSRCGDAGLQAAVASSDVLIAVLGEIPAHADNLSSDVIEPSLDVLLDRCNDPAARPEDAPVLAAIVDIGVLSQSFDEQVSAMEALTPREGVNVVIRAGGRGMRDLLDASAEGRRQQVAAMLEASRVLRAEARSQQAVWRIMLNFVCGAITDTGLDWALRAQAIVALDEQVVETYNGFRTLFQNAPDLIYIWKVVDAAVRINRCGLFLQIDVDQNYRACVSNMVLAAIGDDTLAAAATTVQMTGLQQQQQQHQQQLDLQLVSLRGAVPHTWLNGRLRALIDGSVDAVDVTRADILVTRRVLARQAALDRELQRRTVIVPPYETMAAAIMDCDAAARFVIEGKGSVAAATDSVMASLLAV
jgi:hypothetical protein